MALIRGVDIDGQLYTTLQLKSMSVDQLKMLISFIDNEIL